MRFRTLGTQVALNLLILIPRGIIILHYVTIGKTYFFPGELAMYITRFITHLVPKQGGPLTPNLRLAAQGPIYWICLILIINHLHCQIQICVSCLFGETGAQRPSLSMSVCTANESHFVPCIPLNAPSPPNETTYSE